MEAKHQVTAVIVEDMPEVLHALRELIADHCPEVELLGTADSVVSGARLLASVHPQLVFLDIELPDGSGFDLLDITNEPVRVIFTTASDAHAVRAFRYAAIDYLLKPIDPEGLVAAVSRARNTPPPQASQLNVLSQALNQDQPERIALHTSDRVHIVEISSIMRCAADGNYTHFYLSEGRPVLVARTLKEYDKLLSTAGFLRVHQSHLVNIRHVREYVKTDGVYLVMKDGAKVPVSVRKRHEVLRHLDGLRP
ncbi:MAG: LytTR family DNA-binding domain-containing protein [Saprospiraceae bacterium]|nr:LytTR family DNA-binding domain-containing protein [Saprospiraceae bacterium]